MTKDVILSKLSTKLSPDKNTVILEIVRGKPYSEEGGTWIEVTVEDLESITEAADFDAGKSGYGKYLEAWYQEGLITEAEKDTGKSEIAG
jgi:hypothetical protein